MRRREARPCVVARSLVGASQGLEGVGWLGARPRTFRWRKGRGAAAIAVFGSAGYIITRYDSPGAFGVGVFTLACSAAALMFARAAWERVILVAMFIGLSVWLLRRGL